MSYGPASGTAIWERHGFCHWYTREPLVPKGAWIPAQLRDRKGTWDTMADGNSYDPDWDLALNDFEAIVRHGQEGLSPLRLALLAAIPVRFCLTRILIGWRAAARPVSRAPGHTAPRGSHSAAAVAGSEPHAPVVGAACSGR